MALPPLASLFLCVLLLPSCSKGGSDSSAKNEPGLAKEGETSREQALAFFRHVQAGNIEAIHRAMPVPDDCALMSEALAEAKQSPAECRAGIEEMRNSISSWLPQFQEKASRQTATGDVRFEPIPESNVPSFVKRVLVETQDEQPFPLAAFEFNGSYRFLIPLKKEVKTDGGKRP